VVKKQKQYSRKILTIVTKCQRCFGTEKLNIHHIKPLRFGGTNERFNLMVLCWYCHMQWEKRMKGYWKKIYKTEEL